MTLNSLHAMRKEQALRTWFDALPDTEAVEHVDWYYKEVNVWRQLRFNVQCEACEDCGFVFPPDDLTQIRKRDGRPYLVCTSCVEFGEFVRAVLGWAA